MKQKIIIATLLVLGSLTIGVAYAVWNPINTQPSDAYVNSGNKIGFDGGIGNNFIDSPVANTLRFVANNQDLLRLSNSLVAVQSSANFAIPGTNKLYLDGGTNTYLTYGSSTALNQYVGGTLVLNETSSKIIIPSGHRLYLDGGSGNYMTYDSVNSKIKIVPASNIAICIGTGC